MNERTWFFSLGYGEGERWVSIPWVFRRRWWSGARAYGYSACHPPPVFHVTGWRLMSVEPRFVKLKKDLGTSLAHSQGHATDPRVLPPPFFGGGNRLRHSPFIRTLAGSEHHGAFRRCVLSCEYYFGPSTDREFLSGCSLDRIYAVGPSYRVMYLIVCELQYAAPSTKNIRSIGLTFEAYPRLDVVYRSPSSKAWKVMGGGGASQSRQSIQRCVPPDEGRRWRY